MHFRGRLYGFQDLQRMEECIEFRVDDDYLMYLKAQGVRTRYPKGLRDLLYYQPQTSGIPAEHSKSAWVARQSVQFLRDHQRNRPGKPFFLWSSWIAPHPPFAPSEPYDSMYDPADMDPPVFPERSAATLPCWGMRARLDGAHLDLPRIQRIRALYYGLVSQVDDGVGEILAALDALGLAETTVVLFVSDHGDMLGDHGLSQKNVPYEASMRIPMMLRWPRRTEAGRVCRDLVGLDDVLPTLVGGLGLERNPHAPRLPGTSLLGRTGGGLADPRDAYFVDYGSGPNRWICMRTQTHKYALWARGGYEELYDLEADPHETTNLVEREPARAATMRARVLDWEREQGLPESFDKDAFRTHPFPTPATDVPRGVNINEGRWPENLPEDEWTSVETHAEAFTRAIAKETTLAPDKLSLADYKNKGGHPLTGTPWEAAWDEA
jgi:arylsulfatase A-like enzyme